MPRSKANTKPSVKGKGVEGKKKINSQKIARKSAPVTTGVKVAKKRSRPGKVALREIKKYQRSTKLLIQKAPLIRKSKIYVYDSPCGFQLNQIRLRQQWRTQQIQTL